MSDDKIEAIIKTLLLFIKDLRVVGCIGIHAKSVLKVFKKTSLYINRKILIFYISPIFGNIIPYEYK